MNWKVENNELIRELELADFVSCVDLLNDITEIAEEEQHHPDIEIYEYNRMRIRLRTHDSNTVTEKDHELARRIDELL